MKRRIAVIGGGAAGYFGAIACARALSDAELEHEVVLFEATSKPLKKVRISGGGRCNVTHHCFDPALLVKNYPRGSRELRGPFSRFQPVDTVKWFEERGVKLKTEEDGRMFPTTDDSETIAQCLESEAMRAGVEVRLSMGIQSVQRTDPGFTLDLKSGATEHFDKLLIATGSSPAGHRFAQALGHTVTPLVPSLFTFNIKDPRLEDLAGISFESAHLKLSFSQSKERLEQTGPLLITHWGLSGPAVLKLSAFGAAPLHDANYQARLQINLLPHLNPESAWEAALRFKEENLRRTLWAHRPFPEISKRFWQRLLEVHQLPENKTWAEVSKKDLRTVSDELTQGSYQVSGKGVFKEEFVTCGGVSLKEIDFKTMQSKVISGLFFAGEVLNIDGITGGFNFQNAWTTSFIAGNEMGRV